MFWNQGIDSMLWKQSIILAFSLGVGLQPVPLCAKRNCADRDVVVNVAHDANCGN